MSQGDLDKTEPPHLANALSIDPTVAETWRRDELAAILRHQLETPLATDLGDLRNPTGSDDANASPPDVGITFRQLLTSPNPPLPLLERAKRFAKACKNHPDGPLPPEVATVMYFACIASALLHCDTKISALDRTTLLKGLEWSASQQWLDSSLSQLLQRGMAQLKAD